MSLFLKYTLFLKNAIAENSKKCEKILCNFKVKNIWNSVSYLASFQFVPTCIPTVKGTFNETIFSIL